MNEVLFTISSFIEAVMSNDSDNEYTLDSKNDTLEFRIISTGDSLDVWSPENDEDPYHSGEWCEDTMVYQNNYPLEDDEDVSEVVAKYYPDTPCRTHGYSTCYREYTLSLPPARERGDTYTLEQMRAMISDIQNHEDEPGYGFSYHQMPSCDYCSERLENS